jgi:quinol monooxygenase YgiN
MSDNNTIHFRAEVIIEEGKKEEYKKLIQDMSRAVEANEPDTINYRFYLNKSETECIVWKTYTNSEAVLVHGTVLHLKQYFQRFIVSLE